MRSRSILPPWNAKAAFFFYQTIRGSALQIPFVYAIVSETGLEVLFLSPNSRRRKGRQKSYIDIGALFGLLDYSGPPLLIFRRKNPRSQLMKEYEPYTRRLYALLLVLCAFGAIIQYSASCYMCGNSSKYGYDPTALCRKQILFVLVFLVGTFIIQHFNYQLLKSGLAPFLYLASIASIFVLLFSGDSLNGATRSLNLGFIAFAPSELMKVTVPIMMAWFILHNSRALGDVAMTFILWGLGGVPSVLLLIISNDLSSAIVVLLMTFCITLVVCKTWKWHLGVFLLILLAAVIIVLYIGSDLPTADELADLSFRTKRIIAWLAPEQYPNTIGYQVTHTLYAVGSGGFTGNGIGTFQKLKDLVPEAYTDVIFAVIIYELGLLGAAVTLLFYALIIWQMIRICIEAEDLFGSVMVLGYSCHIAIQVLLHIAVVLNLMPNTGQTLPLISCGGTMFLCLAGEFGLVMSVYRFRCYRKADTEVNAPSGL